MKAYLVLFLALFVVGSMPSLSFAQYSGKGSSGTTTTGTPVPAADTTGSSGPLLITTSAKNPDLINPALWQRMSQVCRTVEVEASLPVDVCDSASFYFIGFESYSSIPLPFVGFDCRIYLRNPTDTESCLDQLRDPMGSLRFISFGWVF